MHSQEMNQWSLVFPGNLSSWKAASTRKEQLPYKYIASLCSTREWFKGTAFQTPQCPTLSETCCARRNSDNRILACSYDDIIQQLKKMLFHVVRLLFDTTATPVQSINLNLWEPDLAHLAQTQNVLLVHGKGKNLWRELRSICVLYVTNLLTNILSFK